MVKIHWCVLCKDCILVKYYTYYRRDYHIEDKYYDKYFYLKEAKLFATKSGIRWCKNGRLVKDKQGNINSGKGSYFIKSK